MVNNALSQQVVQNYCKPAAVSMIQRNYCYELPSPGVPIACMCVLAEKYPYNLLWLIPAKEVWNKMYILIPQTTRHGGKAVPVSSCKGNSFRKMIRLLLFRLIPVIGKTSKPSASHRNFRFLPEKHLQVTESEYDAGKSTVLQFTY